MKRIKRLFSSKANKVVSDMENPIEIIENNIENLKEKQNQLLQNQIELKKQYKKLLQDEESKHEEAKKVWEEAQRMKENDYSKDKVKLKLNEFKNIQDAASELAKQVEKIGKMKENLSSKMDEMQNLLRKWETKKTVYEAQTQVNDAANMTFGMNHESEISMDDDIKDLKEAEEKIMKEAHHTEALEEVDEELNQRESINQSTNLNDNEIEEFYNEL